MRRFTTAFLFCAALLVSAGLFVVGCGGGGGGGGTSSGKVGWDADWTDGANHVWGTICGGLDQPFTLNFTSGPSITGTLACSPDTLSHVDAGSGTITENGSNTQMPAGSSLTYSGTGIYTLTTTKLYISIGEQKATLTLPVVGTQVSTVPGFSNFIALTSSTKCN